jgi:hypothetical protein
MKNKQTKTKPYNPDPVQFKRQLKWKKNADICKYLWKVYPEVMKQNAKVVENS